MQLMRHQTRRLFRLICTIAIMATAAPVFHAFDAPASAAEPDKTEPIKIGISLPLTGPAEENGKQLLIALQLWRDDVNAKAGLLGRPVELICEDDTGDPGKVRSLYRKLLTVDKVDLILGPYSTNVAAAAMRTVLEFNKVMISVLGVNVNRIFDYWRFFSISPLGSEGPKALSTGFFDLAAAHKPKPKTVAILAVETDFAKSVATGARENAATFGYDVVYDKDYSPTSTDLAPTMREAAASNADIVFVATSGSDAADMVRAAADAALKSKMFGGVMNGLQATATKARLGRMLDGVIVVDNLAPGLSMKFAGLADLLKRYRAVATSGQTDPFNVSVAPFGYAAGQVLAQAVESAGSLNSDTLAEYMHDHKFETVVGPIAFAKNGEWAESRTLLTQFQHVSGDGGVERFADGKVQPIIWPPQYKTGDLVYPYVGATR